MAQDNSTLVTTYFVGTVSDYGYSGASAGFFSSPIGSAVSGTFSFDSSTIGSPEFSSSTQNEWIQADQLPGLGSLLPNTIPAHNLGMLSASGQGGSFAALALQFMWLTTDYQTLGWGGAPLQFNINDANFAIVCDADTNVNLPITIPTAFPLSMPPPNCSANINLSYNLNQAFLTINITSLSGQPATCPSSTISPSGDGPYTRASFMPCTGTVTSYASDCGYDRLDWQQQITHFPPTHNPKPLEPDYVSANIMDPQNVGCLNITGVSGAPNSAWNTNCYVFAGNGAPPLFDPPPGGDENSARLPSEDDSYPFYYPAGEWSNFNNFCGTVSRNTCVGPTLPTAFSHYVIDNNGTTMNFMDGAINGNFSGCPASSTPQRGCQSTNGQSTNAYALFTTYLMGLTTEQIPGSQSCGPNNNQYVGFFEPAYYCTIIHSFTWSTTAKQYACTLPLNEQGECPGVKITSQNGAFYPIIPGSGTGGVTITGIDGVALPPNVLASNLALTASGLAYSRVSQTFNGTVSLKNTSGATMAGPLQIFLFGLPPNVNLVNQSANLSGTPYLTVPIAEGLAPGVSVSVPVQFKNPANAAISVQPTVYAGTIQ